MIEMADAGSRTNVRIAPKKAPDFGLKELCLLRLAPKFAQGTPKQPG